MVQKGQKISLSQLDPTLEQIEVAMGWDLGPGGRGYDLDVEAFLLKADGTVPGDDWFVFYNQPGSPDGAVRLLEASVSGDDAVIQVRLSQVNPGVAKIAFIVTINEARTHGRHFGNVANALGVGQLLADALVPHLNTSNLFLYLLAIAVICFLLNFVMTPMAVFSALLVPLTIVTMGLPNVHDVFPLLNAVMLGVGNLLLPHATTNSLILYGFDVMSMKDFVKSFGVKALLSFAWLFIAVLYWKAIGLLG